MFKEKKQIACVCSSLFFSLRNQRTIFKKNKTEIFRQHRVSVTIRDDLDLRWSVCTELLNLDPRELTFDFLFDMRLLVALISELSQPWLSFLTAAEQFPQIIILC